MKKIETYRSSKKTNLFCQQKQWLVNIHHHAGLIWTKAIFNLRSETQRNYLSYVWWLLEPLAYMVVYYLVFGVLLGRGGDGFTTFLLTGLIPWMWFNKAVSSSGNSIVAGQGLLLQVSVSPAIFPLISILQASLKQIPVFFLLLVFIWFQGVSPSLIWLNLLPLVLLQLLMTIAVGGLLAALMPFARDIGNLVPTGLTFVMFMSGIFYSYKDVPSEWQSLFLLNPIAFLLKSYREILIEGVYPSVTGLVSFAFIAIIGCAAVALLISRLRYTYPKIVLS